jgi:DHA1 family bicyclomycin/chloramphenicol resistance-like MFS transporter
MQHLNPGSSVLPNTRPAAWYSNFFLPLLLVIMGAYPPLSTDMYLPSLPDIARTFNTSEAMVNLTLVLFFVFFAFSTLIWGPISDKFGRKSSLIAGIGLFSLTSSGCVLSNSINQLIFWRVLQALGAGAPVTISIAIVQDTYTGNTKKKILSILTALMMAAPVAAPTIGAIILAFAQWRTVFVVLLALGLVSLAGCFFITETIPEKNNVSVFHAFGSLFHVLKDPFLAKALAAFSLPALYALGFVGGSTLIFMTEFGVSSAFFSICFATNAMFAILGAALYVPLLRWFSNEKMILLAFLSISVSGGLIVCFGGTSAVVFLICVIPGTLMTALLRPLSVDLMMNAGGPKSGALAAMINFFFAIIGSIGMQILAMEWESRVTIYGIIAVITGMVCLLVWTKKNSAGR